MTFRDFTEETKEAVAALLAGMRGDRDITPMVHLQSEDGGREIIGVEAKFFTEPGRIEQLIDAFIIPLIQERMAQLVAWTFMSVVDDARVVVAVVVDRERHETWMAHFPPRDADDWVNVGANTATGLMVTPVQEALR